MSFEPAAIVDAKATNHWLTQLAAPAFCGVTRAGVPCASQARICGPSTSTASANTRCCSSEKKSRMSEASELGTPVRAVRLTLR